LPFKITEAQLKEEFVKHGEISEVNLLKKPDGKIVGCAFIQYKEYNSSINAIKSLHGKDFQKRKISVDFAVSKNRYQKDREQNNDEEIKEEKPEVKEEDPVVKEDPAENEKEESDESGIDSDSDNSDEDDSDGDNEETDEKPAVEVKKEKKKYTEADNELTVFVKNLNFDTTNEDLEKCFKKFGPLKYALVVKDPISGHSKGTGFIRFLRKESVEICLAQSGKIILQDFPLEVHHTLSKKTVKDIAMQKEKNKTQPKDSRNLYLLREGMILAGSEAAEGVSASDMAKRLRLEQIKSQMLKNLTRFLARDRLTIHNLPESYDDDKLRKMVLSRTTFKVRKLKLGIQPNLIY
jgi:nucleolar protein 4